MSNLKIFSIAIALLFSSASSALTVYGASIPPSSAPALISTMFSHFEVKAYEHSSNSNSKGNTLGDYGLATGLTFNVGQSITGSVSASDLWSTGALPRWSNADGLTRDFYATGSDDSGETAGTHIGKDWGQLTYRGLTAAYGSLVGAIEGEFFLLGSNFDVAAPIGGELKLFHWDSNYLDNIGSINVGIQHPAAVPVPAAVWLLASAVIGLVGVRKKSMS